MAPGLPQHRTYNATPEELQVVPVLSGEWSGTASSLSAFRQKTLTMPCAIHALKIEEPRRVLAAGVG